MNVKAENETALVVTWKNPKCIGLFDLKRYRIKYKKTGEPVFSSILVDLKHCCSYKITNLDSGVSYKIRVSALNDAGVEGAPSDITEATTEGIFHTLFPNLHQANCLYLGLIFTH